MYPLLLKPKTNHRYKAGTSFDQVLMLYRFDKKLRILIFNEIEKIEIAVRCAIVESGCKFTNNPFWMTDQTNFKDITKFNHTLALIDSEVSHSDSDSQRLLSPCACLEQAQFNSTNTA